ncbi:SGNH/GDSL hydrolase family protein [Amycolatopsis acidicola]|uniref:SGNH/GDSL hydrolase family protein n=1 Tax=Amycolatopsis acidicola TaxID=2596893 RepID=A0A5N0UQV6_9PSEU|nr:SGNH/GDSL hydrolase family protein [Amycolatopsis acidicola]KAA9151254.1 SGNH/GDSL hydrolase family protein [Amycolatopsis acidicola]
MATIRLTVLGDSFVEGRGDPAAGGGYAGWVPRFAGLLRLPAAAVRNLGTYQATTADVVAKQLPRALAGKPPLIGVIAGVNDLVQDYDRDRFRRNLHTIFASLSGMDTTVFTAGYPDIPGNLPVPESFRRLLRARFAEANEALADVCALTGTLRLELERLPEWRRREMWSADGLHPSPLGHRVFAESMAENVAALAMAA